jgi:superfamily II DNA or RNA helicase
VSAYKLYSFPDAKLLGLSATNIRYLDNQRDMADELFEGNIASEMTIGEAIARGILLASKYVISVYAYQKELDVYTQRVHAMKSKAAREKCEKELEMLRRSVAQADGLDVVFQRHMENCHGKYIVFWANKEHISSGNGITRLRQSIFRNMET